MRWISIVILIAIILMGCTSEKPELPSETEVKATVIRLNDSYRLYVTFTLPNPCHKMKYVGMKAYGHEIDVYFEYKPPKPDEVCIQKLEVFKWSENLGNLTEGDYVIRLFVNDRPVKVYKFSVTSKVE